MTNFFYFPKLLQFSMPCCFIFHLPSLNILLSALLFQWLSFCITILHVSKKNKMKHACNAIADSNYYSRNSTTITLHAPLICFYFILQYIRTICTYKELSLDQSYNHRKKELNINHMAHGLPKKNTVKNSNFISSSW